MRAKRQHRATPAPLSRATREQFQLVLNGYAFSQALAAACELDLFSLLSRKPRRSLAQVARDLRLARHSARVLLLACSALRLVARGKDGSYTNTPVSEALLVSTRPDNLLSFIKLGQKIQYPGCAYFAESLRSGTNQGLRAFPGRGTTLYDRISADPALERVFHEGMAQFTRQTNQVLVSVRALAPVRHLVDIGGGDATNAIALCRAFPQLQVTVFDVPSVCALAMKKVTAARLDRTIAVRAGDAFVDPLPEGMDGALLSHFVEIFSEQRIRALYQRVFRALPARGRLIVWTLTCNDDETGPLQAAKSSVYFLSVASGEGMAYPARDHVAWLKAAGFERVSRVGHTSHTLLVAYK